MRTNIRVTEGFKNRKYPKNRKSRGKIPPYQHVQDPAGRTWSIITQLTGEQLTGETNGHLITRKFAAAGVTKERIFALVEMRCPEYGAHYRQMTGKPLTPHITRERWHKACVYSNGQTGKGGKGAQSPLHYTQNKLLRAVFPEVEHAFRTGLALSLEQMIKLGEIPCT